MDPELKKQLDQITRDIAELKRKNVVDHRHTGLDASRVRISDLETVYFQQATIDPGNLVDGAGATVQVTGVAGATLGDWVIVSAPYDLQDITVTPYIQSTGVVEIRIQNESGSTIDLGSGIWRILIIKKIV